MFPDSTRPLILPANVAADAIPRPLAFRSTLAAAFAELLRAFDYACDVQRDVWDFAVEARSLRRLGLTTSDFRWLTCKGYVLHSREVTAKEACRRSFTADGELSFGKRSCFVLTEAGVAVARDYIRPNNARPFKGDESDDRAESPVAIPLPGIPAWDAELHELCVGSLLVKRFKWPALNQETVLAAFQEETWPIRIDDPLPPRPELEPKRRLHDTIKSLNRNQKNQLLRFKGDGTGQGVRWEFV